MLARDTDIDIVTDVMSSWRRWCSVEKELKARRNHNARRGHKETTIPTFKIIGYSK